MKTLAIALSTLSIFLTSCSTFKPSSEIAGIWTPTIEYRNQRHEEKKRKQNGYPLMELSVLVLYFEITEENGKHYIDVFTNVSDERHRQYKLQHENGKILLIPTRSSKWAPAELVIKNENHIDLISPDGTMPLTRAELNTNEI